MIFAIRIEHLLAMPVHPRLGRLLSAATREGWLREGAALAALLLGAGWFFVGSGGPLGRVGALALALGLLATAGLLPYLADFEPEEPTSSSCLVWTAFFAPALALSLAPRVLTSMNPPEGTVFAATLIALGLVNLGWGGIAAWRISGDAQAWRYSFVAEWGLALVGMGLLLRDGRAGETYNVGTGDERSIEGVADLVLRILDKPASLKRYVDDRPGHDRRYLLDSSKIRAELGWEATVDFAAP